MLAPRLCAMTSDKEKELTEELSKAREEKFIANWQKRKDKKKKKNKEAESQLKTERKQNLKRKQLKQEAWKLQIQQSKRQKINAPNVQEEDDEKQQEIEEDDNNSGDLSNIIRMMMKDDIDYFGQDEDENLPNEE